MTDRVSLAYDLRVKSVNDYIRRCLTNKRRRTKLDNEYLFIRDLLLFDKENEIRSFEDSICTVNVNTRLIRRLSDSEFETLCQKVYSSSKVKPQVSDFSKLKKLLIAVLNDIEFNIPQNLFALFKTPEDKSTYAFHLIELSLNFTPEEEELFKSEGILSHIPNWSSVLNRMSNKEVFLAFIGSLLDLNSDRTQYLWLFGEGQNGKSTIIEFLKEIFKNTFFSSSFEITKSRFWTSTLLDKRIYVFEDISNFFGINEILRPLTGSDTILIEKKFKEAENVKCFAKFIITSNEPPITTFKTADRRRILPIEISSIDDDKKISNYYKFLLQEKDLFFKYASYVYKKVFDCKINSELLFNDYIELTNDNYLEIIDILERYVEVDNFSYITNKDILKLQKIYYEEFSYIKNKFFVRRIIKEILINKYGAKRVRLGSNIVLKGVKFKIL